MEVRGRDTCVLQAEVHGGSREAMVTLLAGEPLFLSSRDDLAVANQAGCRIVIVSRDTEYVDHAITSSGLASMRAQPGSRADVPAMERRSESPRTTQT